MNNKLRSKKALQLPVKWLLAKVEMLSGKNGNKIQAEVGRKTNLTIRCVKK